MQQQLSPGITIIVIFVTIIIVTILPIAHAEFPGEDDSSNAFDKEVPTNYRTRTFWTLLLGCHTHSGFGLVKVQNQKKIS